MAAAVAFQREGHGFDPWALGLSVWFVLFAFEWISSGSSSSLPKSTNVHTRQNGTWKLRMVVYFLSERPYDEHGDLSRMQPHLCPKDNWRGSRKDRDECSINGSQFQIYKTGVAATLKHGIRRQQ